MFARKSGPFCLIYDQMRSTVFSQIVTTLKFVLFSGVKANKFPIVDSRNLSIEYTVLHHVQCE